MKKRIISLLMISMLIFTLAACKKDEKDAKDGADNSLKYIQDNGKLVLGLDDAFVPMGFRDDKDEIVGFDIDLAQAVCDKLGVELVKQPISWDAKVNELNTKNIDCIWNGLSLTKENQEKMTMSPSYMTNDISLVVSTDSEIASAADLKDKRLALQSGSAAEDTLNSDENKDFRESLAQVNPFDDYSIALLDLESGNSDAVLMDSVVANYLIKTGKNYKIIGDSLLEDKYAIGFRKGDQALCDAVWGALQELKKDGTIEELSTKWFEADITTIE